MKNKIYLVETLRTFTPPPRKIYAIILTFIFSCQFAMAQQEYHLNDKVIHKTNGNWYVKSFGTEDSFPLNGNIITIKYNDNVNIADKRNFEQLNGLIVNKENKLGWIDYEVSVAIDSLPSLALNLNQNNLTEHVIVNTYGEFLQVPNDPEFNDFWYSSVIELTDAWNMETGSNSDVIVAVIDDGLNWNHEDIGFGNNNYQNIYTNSSDAWADENDPNSGNGVDSDNNGLIDDYKGWDFFHNNNDTRTTEGHGTFVAGIIGAKTNNNLGSSGVAGGWGDSGAKIIGIAIHNPNNPLTPVACECLDDAIIYAVDKGAKIINLSLACGPNIAIENALLYADQNNVFVVAASGAYDFNSPNFQPAQDQVSYPASFPTTISVGGTNYNDEMWTPSRYGTRLDVTAPSVDIKSLVGTNDYGHYSGTSFSAPLVSGTAALMLSKNPCLGNRQLKDIILATAEKVGGYDYMHDMNNPGKSSKLGHGRLNVKKAMEEAFLFATPKKDLYMRDRFNDAGRDAGYTWTWDFDASPDIWVRNSNDGFHFDNQFNEEIEFTTSQNKYIYVRIGNKGCTASDGNETVTIYHSVAGTSTTWPDGWTNWTLGGGEIATEEIPVLQPGESVILEIPWTMMYSLNSCILARIDGGVDDPIVEHPGHLEHDIYFNNNVSLNNIIVVNIYAGMEEPVYEGVSYPPGSFFEVGNQSSTPENQDLIFRTGENELGELLTDVAEVVVYFDEVTWSLLSDEINSRDDVTVIDDEKRIVQLHDSLIIFNNINFPTEERQRLYLGINFLTEHIQDKNEYKFHVLQKRSMNDSILGESWTGGVHFRISRYGRMPFYAQAGNNQTILKGQTINLTAEDINESATYNWYNAEGTLVHTGINFSDIPESSQKYKLEVISNLDFFKDYDEIQVNVQNCFIENVSPNPATDLINVLFEIEECSNAVLSIASTSGGGNIHSYMINENDNSIQINTTHLTTGTYTIALICDGQMKDSKTFIIH